MDYKIETITATEHLVTFEDGRRVHFVIKEGDSLEAQILSYLTPVALIPEAQSVSDLDVFIKAVRDKINLTDEDLLAARNSLQTA